MRRFLTLKSSTQRLACLRFYTPDKKPPDISEKSRKLSTQRKFSVQDLAPSDYEPLKGEMDLGNKHDAVKSLLHAGSDAYERDRTKQSSEQSEYSISETELERNEEANTAKSLEENVLSAEQRHDLYGEDLAERKEQAYFDPDPPKSDKLDD